MAEAAIEVAVLHQVQAHGGQAGAKSDRRCHGKLLGASRTCEVPPDRLLIGWDRSTPRTQCLKYQTDQLVDVKRMEKLNNLMFLLMSRGADASAGARSTLRCRPLQVHARLGAAGPPVTNVAGRDDETPQYMC
jgi:hypothetical protein